MITEHNVIDGAMECEVTQTTQEKDIELEVEVPEELTKPQEQVVITESRKLAPRLYLVLHEIMVPAMLNEARGRRKEQLRLASLNTGPQLDPDLEVWLKDAQLSDYGQQLALQRIDMPMLKRCATR